MDDRESFKTGAPTFSIFIMAQTKCAQHQLSRRWNIYHQKYIFGSNFHSKPSAGMALDILAPSYVNVKVMDVWRVLRMNRWLLDGQHFITWRGRRGAEMLPSVTSEGENTQIKPALCLQMDSICIPTQLLLSFFWTHLLASYPDQERRWIGAIQQTDNFRRAEIWRCESRRHYLPGVTNVNIAPHKGWHSCHHIY